ncbi:hypothetical protein TEA_016933 [Camellia sinensis var. sinensis]|uniref:J domain-containing protein n=1 Tax=Camellia sinensis var. sinensis TaxID=542762 RepID=A0A4S4E0B1_CAMSN|nr:hypothetical protein TEA_016933 [Camellia sinensis var. sinensis]
MDSLDYEAIQCPNVNEISNSIRELGMNSLLAERIKRCLASTVLLYLLLSWSIVDNHFKHPCALAKALYLPRMRLAGDMDDEVNHYIVLGLPSGEEGIKLSEKEITKAYRKKALELHPDKRRDNHNAHSDIQQLNASYAILKDERARKSFDDLLRIKHEKIHFQVQLDLKRQAQWDSKRQKLMSDLEARERVAFASDSATKAREEEEERIFKKFKDEFGEVEDVVIKSSKKRVNALIVVATKDDMVSAARNVYGNLSNPLCVLPLQPSIAIFPSSQRSVEPASPKLTSHFGAGFEDFSVEESSKVDSYNRHPFVPPTA